MGASAPNVVVAVYGPTAVVRSGERVAVRRRERSVLAALALRHPRPCTTDDLVDLVWPEAPPPTARKAVQNHIARIRRGVGDGVVVTGRHGYELGPRVVLDTARMAECVREARAAAARHDHEHRARLLVEVVTTPRGPAFADLADSPDATAASRRLAELVAEAEEDLAGARLCLGHTGQAIGRLTQLVDEDPARERRWWLLVLALYRAGRRRDSLDAYQRARRALALAGLEPGDELRRLERMVVMDDPVLLGTALLVPAERGVDDLSTLAQVFVGRRDELARLDEVVRAAADGTPRLVEIIGEAGIGKTALARRFALEVARRGTAVVWGTCDAAPTIAFQPFARVLDELVERAGRSIERWLPEDASLLESLSPRLAERSGGRPVAPDRGRHLLHDAVVHTLRAAATTAPLVVVLDDLHLGPPATRRLASDCVAAASCLVVLATTREPLGIGGAARESLELSGLDASEIGEFLAAVSPGIPATARTAERLAALTGGNPLLVREVVAHGRDHRAEGELLEVGITDPVLERVRPIIEERLAGLTTETRRVVSAAAVLGPRFAVADLAAMAGPVAGAVHEAVQAGMLRAGRGADELEFSHELLRRAVYDLIPAGALMELHHLAATAVAGSPRGPERAGVAARHRLAAASLEPSSAVASARDAATDALAACSYEEAADLYAGALEAGRAHRVLDARGECELLISRGEALRRAGDPANVGVLVEAAERAEELGDGDLMARAALCLCKLGPTSEAGGSDERATALAARALRRAGDPGLRAELAGSASLAHSMSGEHGRCRALFEQARREAAASGDDGVTARVLPFAYLALGMPDDLDDRADAASRLLELGDRLGDDATTWEGLQLLFSVELQQGEPALFSTLDRIRGLTDVLREPTRRWAQCYLDAAAAHVRGDLDRAESCIDASAVFAGVVSPSRVYAAYGAQLLGIRADQGRLGELSSTVDALVVDQPGVPAWRAAMAWIAATAGDEERARSEIDELARDGFTALPEDFVWSAAMFALGRAAAGIGDADRSALVHRRLAPFAGRLSWFGTGSYGPIDLVLAETASATGDRATARRHGRAARAVARRLGATCWDLEAVGILGRVGA